MAHDLPYMLSTGTIPRVLEKIREAKTPDRLTRDFLSNKLGFNGSNARPFISFAKRIGLLSDDGSPTDLYKQFRNPDKVTSGAAIAQAIRKGYADLFSRNENVHALNDDKLRGLIIEATGMESASRVVQAVVGSFKELKKLADFNGELHPAPLESPETEEETVVLENQNPTPPTPKGFGLNLAYTVNLVLPKTDDISVFNAIFKSLRENLLR